MCNRANIYQDDFSFMVPRIFPFFFVLRGHVWLSRLSVPKEDISTMLCHPRELCGTQLCVGIAEERLEQRCPAVLSNFASSCQCFLDGSPLPASCVDANRSKRHDSEGRPLVFRTSFRASPDENNHGCREARDGGDRISCDTFALK